MQREVRAAFPEVAHAVRKIVSMLLVIGRQWQGRGARDAAVVVNLASILDCGRQHRSCRAAMYLVEGLTAVRRGGDTLGDWIRINVLKQRNIGLRDGFRCWRVIFLTAASLQETLCRKVL